MQYDWDDNKNDLNVEKHGIDFEEMLKFDWGTAVTTVDTRRNYGEVRKRAFGLIDDRFYAVAYTEKPGDVVRVISLRKANKKEVTKYAASRSK